MYPISRNPVYNLKAVLKETGLTADVLRAWERRYGLPSPERTPGGHRLYSQYDIETLKWLQAQREEGLSIGRAVALWNEQLESGHDPLAESPALLPVPGKELPQSAPAKITLLRERWVEACLAFDEHQADQALSEAFAFYPVEVVCTSILQRALAEIGERWYRDEVSVQQEHFASALAARRMHTLIASLPYPNQRQTILLACPPNEEHALPLLLLNLLLRRNGLGVIYLGANVSLDQMTETAAEVRPDLIVLASQHLTSAASLQTAASLLQRADFPVAYGGLIFNRIPRLRDQIPAYFLGEDLAGSVELIKSLAEARQSFPAEIHVDEGAKELAEKYGRMKPFIERELFEIIRAIPGEHSNIPGKINDYFGRELSAALKMCDLDLLEPEMQWVEELLSRRNIPEDRLLAYLAAYSQAVRTVMGSDGESIARWIDGYLARNR